MTMLEPRILRLKLAGDPLKPDLLGLYRNILPFVLDPMSRPDYKHKQYLYVSIGTLFLEAAGAIV